MYIFIYIDGVCAYREATEVLTASIDGPSSRTLMVTIKIAAQTVLQFTIWQ